MEHLEGPIYDLTHLVPDKVIDWKRIFTLRNPGEWESVWVSDLIDKEKNRKLLFMPESQIWVFFPHLDVIRMPMEDGKTKLYIGILVGLQPAKLDETSKRRVQECFPDKIIILQKSDEPNRYEVQAITYDDLNLRKAELTEEDYLWEKRYLLEKEHRQTMRKLKRIEAELAGVRMGGSYAQ